MSSEQPSYNTFWKTGDMGSFKCLMKEFGPALHYFADSMTGNRQEAEEIVSDVFIKIWQQRENLPPPGNIKFYLFKAVKNTALNYLKSKDRRASHHSAWEVQVKRLQGRNPEEIMISKGRSDFHTIRDPRPSAPLLPDIHPRKGGRSYLRTGGAPAGYFQSHRECPDDPRHEKDMGSTGYGA